MFELNIQAWFIFACGIDVIIRIHKKPVVIMNYNNQYTDNQTNLHVSIFFLGGGGGTHGINGW